MGESRFTLLQFAVAANTDLSPGDRVAVESGDSIGVHRRLTYQTLTQAAQDRLEATIEDIITANEQRFIDFYNNAQPRPPQAPTRRAGGYRRHAPRGNHRRAEAGPFADFADLEARVDSLHDPQTLLVERALTELREVEEVRYKLLVN